MLIGYVFNNIYISAQFKLIMLYLPMWDSTPISLYYSRKYDNKEFYLLCYLT